MNIYYCTVQQVQTDAFLVEGLAERWGWPMGGYDSSLQEVFECLETSFASAA